ncbi:Hypothetical protein, putative [Bodo saltans]|uniref:Uncharacterized protein n=1 Tax=Bodo saltans TaxID=75058 RepID=A0A0S4JP42_BODSA|nr:Hypothetical protein, putative [Bodo saltans]|eukprot:CUG93319.1 Hypothetical protein, putative [Bodo saltans]
MVGLPISASVPSDVFVAQQVGTSIFCTVEGRLVCLHVKTDHTFLITVTQEPLVLHLGTFRFKALAGGRGEGASVAAYAKAFIEAFEHTSRVGDVALQRNDKYPLHEVAASGSQHHAELGVQLLLNGQKPMHSFSPESSVLGSPRGGGGAEDEGAGGGGSSALSAAAAATRRSSLVALHRDKMDLEMKQLGSPLTAVDGSSPTSHTAGGGGMRSPLKWGQRSESTSSPAGGGVATTHTTLRSDEELRYDAVSQQSIGVVVTFSVFGTLHSVVLHLKSCPAEPDIKEHVIWGIFMDLYRSVSQHRSHAQRLEANAQRHQIERAAFAKRVEKQNGVSASSAAVGKKGFSGSTTPQTSSKMVGTSQRPVESANSSRGGSASTAARRPGSSGALRTGHLEQPFRKLFSGGEAMSDHDGVAPPPTLPSVVSISFTSGGGTGGAAPPSQPLLRNKNLVPPPPPPMSWSYSGKCAYLESTRSAPGCVAATNDSPSPRQRPTSASSDFYLRQGYVKDVQARSTAVMAATNSNNSNGSSSETIDQAMLLHPTAPPSAASIRGTYAGRAVLKNVSTVEIQLPF